MDKTKFHSCGKLLITGEYVVIDGAKALCLPTKKGQSISVEYNNTKVLNWLGLASDGSTWLSVEINLNDWSITQSSNLQQAEYLILVLKTAIQLNVSARAKVINGVSVTTILDFPTDWGLGSSSTFICNVAKWLEIDAFKLHFEVSNGSGYDIAVGMENKALLYSVKKHTPAIECIEYYPSFSNQIYFVHLNQKQISSKEVEGYSIRKKDLPLKKISSDISNITDRLLHVKTIQEFENLLILHEEIISHVLERESIKNELFSDYQSGIVKSLGAWGGDFVLVTAKHTSHLEYFKNKGFSTIIPYSEMIS